MKMNKEIFYLTFALFSGQSPNENVE